MRYHVIDAFTSTPFTGNPAAVVPLDRELPDALLQSIAAEFNLAETAFPRRLLSDAFELRWFTPTREVPLCGHATLAAAHALWQSNAFPSHLPLRFLTRESGTLTCTQTPAGWIQMDFPATPPQPVPLPPDAAQALSIDGPVTCIGNTVMNLTLRLASEAHVRSAKPNLATLAMWHPVGVTITAPADDPATHFVSRFFAPNAGIPEDPVTGAAHCALVPYWAKELRRTTFTARQLSKRTGTLRLELHKDRVLIIGQAITTMQGELIGLPT